MSDSLVNLLRHDVVLTFGGAPLRPHFEPVRVGGPAIHHVNGCNFGPSFKLPEPVDGTRYIVTEAVAHQSVNIGYRPDLIVAVGATKTSTDGTVFLEVESFISYFNSD